jgi:hypothetical protein
MPLPFTARSLDPDAAAFCARSGASDRAALSAFVRGVKDLGLWESMVAWPLRSTQNAGTGTTAYSLGGLGTYNGTLIDGPVWGTDGVNFADNTTQHILTTLTPSSTADFVIFSAFQQNAGGTTLNAVCGSRDAVSFFSCFHISDNVTRAVLWGSSTILAQNALAVTDGSYTTAAYRYSGLAAATQTVGLTLNTSAETTASGSTTISTPTDPLILGAENATNLRTLSGNLPFLAYIRASSIDNAALRNLYCATLGAGLGLP